MADESDDFKRLIHDLIRVRLDRPLNVELRLIPGSVFPAKLVLTLQDRPDLERALCNSGARSHSGSRYDVGGGGKDFSANLASSADHGFAAAKIKRKPSLSAFIRIDIETSSG